MPMIESVANLQHSPYELFDSYNSEAANMAKKATAKVPAKAAPKPEAGEDLGTGLVAMPKSTALSTDVGMIALNHLAAMATDEQMIDDLRPGITQHRGKAQVLLAIACHRAGLGDKSINLLASVNGDKAAKNKLGKQIRLAIGLMVSDGKKTVLTPEADAVLNEQPGDDAKTLKRKKSIRANFSTMLTKSMRVAHHALENNLVIKEENGFLRLADTKKSGGVMAKHFGEASVLLNEDQNVPVLDKKGKPTGATKALKVLPSFTEIMREVGKSHGVEIVPRVDSRVKSVDAATHIIEVAENLQKAITNLPGKAPENVVKALTALRNAIDKVID
jgi:hypothetical protein